MLLVLLVLLGQSRGKCVLIFIRNSTVKFENINVPKALVTLTVRLTRTSSTSTACNTEPADEFTPRFDVSLSTCNAA
jgi:hypothetical protein